MPSGFDASDLTALLARLPGLSMSAMEEEAPGGAAPRGAPPTEVPPTAPGTLPDGAPPARLATEGDGVAPGLPAIGDVPVLNTDVASGEPATPEGAATPPALEPAGTALGAPPADPGTAVEPWVSDDDPGTAALAFATLEGSPPSIAVAPPIAVGVTAAALKAEAPGAAKKSAAVPAAPNPVVP